MNKQQPLFETTLSLLISLVFILFSTFTPVYATDSTQANPLSLTVEEQNWLDQQSSIKLMLNISFEPVAFLNQNNQVRGIAPDIFLEYSSLIGKPIELIPFDSQAQDLPKFANSDKAHGVAMLFQNNQLEQLFDFTPSYLESNLIFFSKKQDKPLYRIPSDLKGKTVVILKNNALPLRYLQEIGEVNIVEVNTPREQMQMVVYGEADLFLGNKTYHYLINKHFFNNLTVAFSSQETFGVSVGVNQQHPLLTSILSKAISAIDRKQLNAIFSRWLFLDDNVNSIMVANKQHKNGTLNEADLAYLQKFNSLKMCIDPDWMPFEKFEGQQHIGMTADYFKLIQQKLPVPIELVYTTSWNESLEMGIQRKCDLFSLVMPTPDRLLYLNFSDPYIQTPMVLVTKSTEPFIDNVTLVTDRKIGIVQGYAYAEILRNKHPKMQIVDVDNLESGMELVNKGELYGLIGTLATVSYHIQKSYIGELKITGKFDEKWELGIGVRNDEPRLVDIFSKIIENLPAEVHQDILNKWVSVTYESGFDYKLFSQIVALLALILIGFFYWNYRLAKAHKKTTAALQALHHAEEKLQLLATTDHLTGIFNRLKLDEIVEAEIQRCKRNQRPFSALLIDIDHFKQINDEHGHLVGDEILKEVTRVIQHRLRETDYFGRWGGEEFLIICPETNTEQASKLAETIRQTIQNHEFSGAKKISLSVGVTSSKNFDSNTTLTSRADQALYQAKHSGRNCVITID